MDHFPLKYRIAAGIAIFAFLAITDLVRKGKRATRWREYLFLLACVAVAMIYGIINDQITSRISWEYFYYGKELAPVLGPQTPPDSAALHWQAVRIGVQATWAAGLIAGAAVLCANTWRQRTRPAIGYAQLFRLLVTIFLFCIVCAMILGVIASAGGLNWITEDFREMAELNLWRPKHFMGVYGIHLGGYVGGLLGTIWAVAVVLKRDKRGLI